MDQTTEQLVTYASEFSTDVLTAPVKDATLRHLVDTVTNMVVGSTAPAAKIATRLASLASAEQSATIIGSNARSTPDLATFANMTMVRAWDWQDGMYAKGGGQPSSMVPALLAIAEVTGASVEELFVAMVLAYEFLGALGNTIPVREMNWGQMTFMGPACALGVGKLLKLDKEQLANAVTFAMCPGVGNNLGMRQAVFSAQLAKEGMTGAIDRSSGSKEPFDGAGGIWSRVPDRFERTELRLPAMGDGGPMVVEMSYMKMFPSELHSQGILALAPKIGAFTTVDEIESVEIEGYWHLVDSLGTKPSTWDPKDVREAGLSLPYMLLVTLIDGNLTRASFTPERFSDPSLRPIMKRFTIREDPELTANYRPPGMEISGNPRARISIRKKSGEQFHEEITYPKGHMMNPMTKEDINAKMDSAFSGVVDNDRKEEIRSTWWNIESAMSIADAMKTLANFG